MASFLDHLPARQEDLVASRDLLPHYDGVLLAWGCRSVPFPWDRESQFRPEVVHDRVAEFRPCRLHRPLGPRKVQALSRTLSIPDPVSAGARPRMMGPPAASGATTAPPPRFEHSASSTTAANARSALRSHPVRRERRDASCKPLREAAAVGVRR